MKAKTFKVKILFPAMTVVIAAFVFALFLEIVLRFLPVCDGGHRQPVNQEHPVFKFEANRTYQWSQGWRFTLHNKISVNNDGFISSIDYAPGAGGPLVAVIGDSYVEALMVPYEETGQGRLMEALRDQARVYSFAIRGSPLSQYLAFAEYARDKYRPDAMVFAIVGNDFDESLLAYKDEPGYFYFAEQDDGRLELELVDFVPSNAKALVRKSALARYMMINLELMMLPSRLRARSAGGDPAAKYAGNTRADTSPERVRDSKRAVDAFLAELPARSGLDPSRILLVVDGFRPHMYDPEMLAKVEGSYFHIMRDYIIERAAEVGFGVSDMHVVFTEHYAEHGERFEYPTDTHWNSLGHEMFFEEMYRSNAVQQVLPE
jgi:hypothetical protein